VRSRVRAGFGTKLAWIASRDQEIVLVGEGDADAAHAAQLAVAVGIDKVAGYLKGGMHTWLALSLPTDSLARIDVPTLYARRQELQVLDVRERQEWDEGHIPGLDPHALPRRDRDPEGSIRAGPWPLSAPRGSAAPWQCRCWRCTAPPTWFTSPAAAWAPGSATAGRSRRQRPRSLRDPGRAAGKRDSRDPGGEPGTVHAVGHKLVDRRPRSGVAGSNPRTPRSTSTLAALTEEIQRRGGLGGSS